MIRKANLKQEGFKVMGEIIIPQGYKSALNLHDTQVAIKTVKDYFQHELTHRLHLLRVTAPLFVQPETGLNDNLNGVEHPVSFELKDQGTKKTADIEVPNHPVDMSSWGGSACYPRSTFYPLSDGVSIHIRRITMPQFPACSACLPPSQAPLCHCTL